MSTLLAPINNIQLKLCTWVQHNDLSFCTCQHVFKQFTLIRLKACSVPFEQEMTPAVNRLDSEQSSHTVQQKLHLQLYLYVYRHVIQ
jgi:protein-arginine kinase activator protein McsA